MRENLGEKIYLAIPELKQVEVNLSLETLQSKTDLTLPL